MKKILFCCAIMLVLGNVGATGEEAKNQNKKDSNAASGEAKGPNIFAVGGPYIGIGASLSTQQSSCDVNQHFVGASRKVHSLPFGVGFVVGFDRKISDNFSLGVESGVDFGLSGKKHGVGSVLAPHDPDFRTKARDVNTFFVDIGRNFNTTVTVMAVGLGLMAPYVNANVYANFANTLRYIGGADTALNNVFISGARDQNGIYDAVVNAPNAAATFSNFMNENHNILNNLGGANIDTINLLREFVTTYYPNLATVLRSLNDGGGMPLLVSIADEMSIFFENNTTMMSTLTQGDVSASSVADIQSAREALDSYTHNVSKAAENGSASFGVSPHLALRFGFHMPEIESTLFFKTGFAYISGEATFDMGIGNKKFGRVALWFGIEMNKKVDNVWGVGVELSHTVKITKKFGQMKILDISFVPKVDLSRTTLRMFVTFYL